MKHHLKKLVLSKPFLYISAIILAAIAFRFIRIGDFAIFGHDNSRDNILAYKMYEFGSYIYVGPVFSVIWGYMSPIYYYMLYPFYLLFGFSPFSAPIASQVANIAALILCVYIAFKYYGKAAAFISAILFGFSVYVIKQGGEGLNPSLMLPFSLLAYYSYLEWLKTNKNKFLYWFAFALSFVTALHPAGFFLLVPFVVLFFLYKPKLKLKPLVIASAIYGVIGVLPYLYQEKKLAWWTFKQFIKFLKDGSGIKLPFTELVSNFFTAVLRNISLVLFNSQDNQIGLVIGALIIGFLIYEAFTIYKRKNYSNVLAFTLLLYLLTFGILVKFDTSEPHTKWFDAAFIPLIILYISSLLTRLYHTNYWYASLAILGGFFLLNMNLFVTSPKDADSYNHMREVTEAIRKDSNGENIDIYGFSSEPVYYMLWFYETDAAKKEKYFDWIHWSKEKDGDNKVVYFLETSSDLDHNDIELIKDKHHIENKGVIYTTSLGKKVYVFR